MLFTLATVASLIAATQARLVGIAVPETIKPGDTIDVTILTENYIQSVYDVSIAIGWAPGDGYPESLGVLIDSFYLGRDQSNQLHNLTKKITIPASAPKGHAIITSALTSLYGAVYMPTISNFNVTVEFGDQTSTTLKTSSQH